MPTTLEPVTLVLDEPGLTPSQARFAMAVAELNAERGMPATFRDVCKRLGYKSTNAVNHFVSILEKSGLLPIMPFKRMRLLRLARPLKFREKWN